ncbi:fimbria/pilus outer membrane usher protein [Escherichia coli]|uniref:fimbria/pilus outer membrane usher protein n=1 Tax=Escherichia coli TaxID=562 RepID=UPI000BE60748|nr:fimbria/pilus outer membrane usher protein [Escherichia coli]
MQNHKPYFLFLCIIVTCDIHASDYFDSSLLATDISDYEGVDLSIFSKPGGGLEGERDVSVYINNSFYTRKSLYFRNSMSGALEPDFPEGFFSNILSSEFIPKIGDGKITSDHLRKEVPYSNVIFEQENAKVNISIPQAFLDGHANLKSEPDSWDPGIPAFLMDYRLSGTRNKNSYSLSENLYTSYAFGLNFEGWRARSSANFISNRIDHKSGKDIKNNQFNMFNSYLEKDFGHIRSTIRIGELYTTGMINDSFGFLGATIFSNDEMLNDRLRSYSPTIHGIANSQALVTVSQNGRIVLQTNVPPGPFELNDFTLLGLSGDLFVHIKESNGQEHSFIQPFSSLPEMKREGVTGYSFSVGRYERNGLSDKYEEPEFIYGSYSRGFKHGITLYGESIQSENYQLFGFGSTLSLGEVGAISGDISFSRAQKNNEINNGQSYGFKYSKNKIETGTTLTLATYRYSTSDFYSFNDFVLKDGSSSLFRMDKLKNRVTLNLNQSLYDFGSITLTASQQDYWSSCKENKSLSLSHSFNLYGIYLSNSFSLDQLSGYGFATKSNKTWGLYATIPLRNFFPNKEIANNSLSYNMTKNNDKISHSTSLIGIIPDTRVQYRISNGWGSLKENRSNAFSLNYNGEYLSSNIGYTRTGDSDTIDYSVSGSSVLYPWGIAFGVDSVLNGVGIVDTDGVSGVPVRQGGKTSLFGTSIVSSMTPYTENRIDLDPQDLDEDIFLAQTSKKVTPEKGAVVLLKYDVHKGKQVVFNLRKSDGSLLPFGTLVSLSGRDKENTGIVDDEGRVYLAGVPEKGNLIASFGKGKSCSISFDLTRMKTKGNMAVIEYQGECK